MPMTSHGSDAPLTFPAERRSLRFLMRPAPPVAPEDSLGRALLLMRQAASDSLPVLQYGRLVGLIADTDIADLLPGKTCEEVEQALRGEIRPLLRVPELVLRPSMTQDEVRAVCATRNASLLCCLPVVDAEDYCLGVVHLHDLLFPNRPAPRPSSIGGMATPFGVYLTDGTNQAGVGNLALVASGAAMGLTFAVAGAAVYGGLWAANHYLHAPVLPVFDVDLTPATHDPGTGLLSLGIQLVSYILFFLLMRFTILAGYHAAEHQTVHAIERHEALDPGVVARMPRAHPRCGTNLMAAVLVFSMLRTLFNTFPILNDYSEVIAGLATLLSWRTVGTFLQERFTTRTANTRQLLSGIAAGNELLTKYVTGPPTRTRLWRRVWCMGMIQSLIGMLLVWGLGYGIWAFTSGLRP